MSPAGEIAPPPPPLATLACDDAVAVLLHPAGATPPDRIGMAQQALRAAAGRDDIVISRRASGRPRLAAPYPELAVSIAHREDFLAVAFSPAAAVGIDIELDSSLASADPRRLARDHLSPGEAACIGSLGIEPASDLFLRLWVAKEALHKTTGRGIFDGLTEPDLSAKVPLLLQPGALLDLGCAGWPGYRLVIRRLAYPMPDGPAPAGRRWIYTALARAPR
jgi:4'-phosphopantetheinyl transferase